MTIDNTSYTYDEKGNLIICTALVGSRAHGLNTEESDWDWRGVFVPPTEVLLALGTTVKSSKWLEGKVDDTGYDIGYFLHRATQCDPNILEIFAAPHYLNLTPLGQEMLDLWPHIWSSKRVRDSHIGYAKNQQKKFLNPKDEMEEKRKWKFATAYIRSLYSAIDILRNGSYTIVVDTKKPPTSNYSRFEVLWNIRNGHYTEGEVIDLWKKLRYELEGAYQANPNKEADLDIVSAFLTDTVGS